MERGLFIQLFGSAELLVDGVPVTTKLSAKSLAILCFLVCHEQRRASREKLASMLWSESYETATYNLRYNLWNIKNVNPDPTKTARNFSSPPRTAAPSTRTTTSAPTSSAWNSCWPFPARSRIWTTCWS